MIKKNLPEGKQYNISVFGLGYVGCVTSSCLTKLGHNIIGVDIDNEKIDLLNKAKPPIKEPNLAELLTNAKKQNLLTATSDTNFAVQNSDLSFVCVCTPPNNDGSCNIDSIINLTKSLSIAIYKKYNISKKSKEGLINKHVIIIRSTIPPGTVENIIIPTLENTSNIKNHIDFEVIFHPEFLREGTAIDDFFEPPKYVIGQHSEYNDSEYINNTANANHITASDLLINLLKINSINHNIIKTNYKTAELLKYTDNVWHALKVSFANEMGTLATEYDIDARELMDIFCTDKKLNISEYYLKPGLSYGGSCLPKEVESTQYLIKDKNLDLPVLNSINESNDTHTHRTYNFIKSHIENTIHEVARYNESKSLSSMCNKSCNVSWYGITFKDNTDDLRNSISLNLFSRIFKDFDATSFKNNITVNFKLFDKNIEPRNIIEAQIQILKHHMGDYQKHFAHSFEKLLSNNPEVLVITHPAGEHQSAITNHPETLTIIDLTNSLLELSNSKHNYFNLYK